MFTHTYERHATTPEGNASIDTRQWDSVDAVQQSATAVDPVPLVYFITVFEYRCW